MALRRLSPALLALGLLSSPGCDRDEDDLRSLDATELDERFACGDVTMVAASQDGDEALLIGIEDELAAKALSSGEVVVAEYDLPDDRLTVRWAAGSNVYQGHCGRDSGERWHLNARKDAIVGHVFVHLEPDEDGALTLTAELADVIFASEGDDWETEVELAWTRFERLPFDD